MATAKLTITLRAEQLRAIRELVKAGEAASVSGFVQHAVQVALFDAAGWKEMLDEALHRTGGPLTKKERAWADRILAPARPKPARRLRRRGPYIGDAPLARACTSTAATRAVTNLLARTSPTPTSWSVHSETAKPW
jgi:Arc/MetJ-type ribon-helix-helix transcriptional regulator